MSIRIPRPLTQHTEDRGNSTHIPDEGITDAEVAAISWAKIVDKTHASAHAAGGGDAITPESIGAAAAILSILAGTGLTGGGTLEDNRTLNLADTAVAPGTYGSSSQSSSVTVDAQGRITNATNNPITAASVGAEPDGAVAAHARATNAHSIMQIADRLRLFNNNGANHPIGLTDFNLLTEFGFHYFNGGTSSLNRPAAALQYYVVNTGLGDEYAGSQYMLQIAIPRNVTPAMIYLRYREAATWTAWQSIRAGDTPWSKITEAPITTSHSSSYGAISVLGSKGGYSGIHFDSSPNGQTFMQHATYRTSGIWSATNSWDWCWIDGVLTYGSVPYARITDHDSGYQQFSFASGWQAYNATMYLPRYRKLGNIVYLSGVVARTTTASLVMATLPAGYRPFTREVFNVSAAEAVGGVLIDVDPSGQIVLAANATRVWLSLSGISFTV